MPSPQTDNPQRGTAASLLSFYHGFKEKPGYNPRMKKLPFFPRVAAISCIAFAATASVVFPANASDKSKVPIMPFRSGIKPGASRQLSAHAPNVVTIDLPGAVASYAFGINNSGESVGYWYDDNLNTHGWQLCQRGYHRGSRIHSLPRPLRSA
ncbi:hypothetical protein [Occallatibacter savannae]|uniref:hypothetical protein n=1 Tax=Occallatibacter savannae TaxID=1002691 RepID=UPI0013A5463B|nr:hypothetical protein [Occallatibacter savannae]